MSYRNHPLWLAVQNLYHHDDATTGIKIQCAQMMFSLEAEMRDYPEEDFSRQLEGAKVTWIPTAAMTDDEQIIREAPPEEIAATLRELGYIVTPPSKITGLA